MLVVTLLRWVDRARVDPLDGTVRTESRGGGPSAADECALEHGLRLAERTGGRCVAVTLAEPEADEMLRDALARGADAALRVQAPASEDEAGTARALASVIRAEFDLPDLVLGGVHSPDRGTGSTLAFLAAELDTVQALGLTSLTWDDARLIATRRLDSGRRERLAVPLPAVCSLEPTGVRPRRAPLPGFLATRDAPIRCVPADPPRRVAVRATRAYRPRSKELAAPASSDPLERVRELTEAARHREPPRIVVADPSTAADELLGFLRDKGYLDG